MHEDEAFEIACDKRADELMEERWLEERRMGKMKSYYFNEINGLDKDGNPLPEDPSEPPEPDYPTEEEWWEEQDKDQEFTNEHDG